MGNPCLRCGACCAYFRVSFYWSEADPFLGGSVPLDLTEPLNPHRSAMRGTLHAPVRCVALDGTVGEQVGCTIYPMRSSPCRELEPWEADGQPSEKCTKARAAHGMPPLEPIEGLPPRPVDSPRPLTA